MHSSYDDWEIKIRYATTNQKYDNYLYKLSRLLNSSLIEHFNSDYSIQKVLELQDIINDYIVIFDSTTIFE